MALAAPANDAHAAPAPLPRLGDPVALFICFDDYKHMDKLEHSVNNGVALATEMHKQGYRVTFITGHASLERATVALKNTTAKLIEANDAVTLEKNVIAWIDDCFLNEQNPSVAPMGFIVINAHGEERDPDVRRAVTYLLTPDDKSGDGGYRIQEIQRRCAKHSLPITMIVDVCRDIKEPLPKKDDKAVPANVLPSVVRVVQARGNRLEMHHGRKDPTTIWAVPKGKPSPDSENDLVKLLTKGLQLTDNKTFVAGDRIRKIADSSIPTERPVDLSMRTWVRHVTMGMDFDSDNPMQAAVDWGSMPPQMIIATTDSANRARLFAMNRQLVDLMGEWEYSTGDFKAKNTSDGIVITRPDATPNKVLYCSGVLVGFHNPIDKVLVCECVARHDDIGEDSKKELKLLVQPNSLTGQYFSTKWNQAIPLQYNRLIRIKVPFDQCPKDRMLRGIAFSADPQDTASWPVDASLTITKMYLVDSGTAKKITNSDPVQPVDLLSRWWISDVIRNEMSKARLRTSYDRKGNITALNLQAEDSIMPSDDEEFGRGGAVFPKVFVDRTTDKIELRLSDCGMTANTKLTITVLANDNSVLAHQSIQVAPANLHKPILIGLNASGFLDYIGVTTTDRNLKASLNSFSVVTQEAKRK